MTVQEGDRQGSKSSRPSTMAIDVDASVTNGEVMAARLRECMSDPSHCDSTARMSAHPLPQPQDTAPAMGSGNSADEPAPTDAQANHVASSRRSHSVPPVDEEDLERQREAARRSAKSDYGVEYVHEFDNKVWQKLGNAEAPTDGPAADGQPQIPSAEHAQQGFAGPHDCPGDSRQLGGAADAVAGEGRQEQVGGSPAGVGVQPPGEVDSPRPVEDAGAAEVRQKLHSKLEHEGKLHLEPLAAEWRMGKYEAINRIWLQAPHLKRRMESIKKAIVVLEELHADREGAALTLLLLCLLCSNLVLHSHSCACFILSPSCRRAPSVVSSPANAFSLSTCSDMAGAVGKAIGKLEPTGEQAAPRNPSSVDQFSALGVPHAAAALQDRREHMSPRRSKLAQPEEEVHTSPGLSPSPPDTPRTRARRQTHRPDIFNPAPPSRQEKKRAHEDARTKELIAAKHAAEERGVSVPLEGPVELPAGQEEALAAAAGQAQGWELPAAPAPAPVRTFSRKDSARGRGTPRGRGHGRKAFAGGSPVRSRRRSVTPGRSHPQAAEDGAEPQPDRTPSQPDGTDSATHTSPEGSDGQAAAAAPKGAAAAAKKRASSGGVSARATKKLRRCAAVNTSAGTSNDRATTAGPGSSNGRTTGSDLETPLATSAHSSRE